MQETQENARKCKKTLENAKKMTRKCKKTQDNAKKKRKKRKKMPKNTKTQENARKCQENAKNLSCDSSTFFSRRFLFRGHDGATPIDRAAFA
jgi:hypothetical protein